MRISYSRCCSDIILPLSVATNNCITLLHTGFQGLIYLKMEGKISASLPPPADCWTVWSPSFQFLRSNSSPSLFLVSPFATMLPLTLVPLLEKHFPSDNVGLRWDVMSAFVVFPCLCFYMFRVYCNTPILLKPKNARQAGTCTTRTMQRAPLPIYSSFLLCQDPLMT